MNIDDIVQELAETIYKEPLSQIRNENDYPNLSNPLHMVVLLIDADTEIHMNGMLGFLENSTGKHLHETIEALQIIGATKCSDIFESVENCMHKHDISWEKLRSGFAAVSEHEITSFRKLHGSDALPFAEEVSEISDDFLLFNALNSPEDAYSLLIDHLQKKDNELTNEIDKRCA